MDIVIICMKVKLMKKTMTNPDPLPLMVDAEVTIKFVIPNFCFYSDIEGDEKNLLELVQQELEENGVGSFVTDEDFFLVDVKIVM
jgi:hypothetical protein